MDIQTYLHTKFLDYERKIGRRSTISDFAQVHGIKPGNMSHWMNGLREPSLSGLRELTQAFGPEVLLLADLHMSPLLQVILKTIHKIPPDQQKRLADLIEAEVNNAQQGNQTQESHPEQRAAAAA